MRAIFLFSAVLLPALGSALAAPSVVREVQGSVEQQLGVWQPVQVGQTIENALRVGSGRALLQSGEGQLLLSSGSMLRINQNEPELLSRQFYLTGKNSFYSQSVHFSSDGRLRLDLTGPTQRLAVIAGQVRVAVGTQVSMLRAGQQYDFASKKISAFAERDPWYLSRFVGEGEARVQATSGPVTIQDAAQSGSLPAPRPAALDELLSAGQQLITGAAAWAEVGFTGGGYLRLQPGSALSVLSIDRVALGESSKREVALQLTRGSVWNVVARGQGGYQITTPTITTAVRGTVFRVDAGGLVKVFEGQVALPGSDVLLTSGQQRTSGGEVQPLVVDAVDEFNQALDKQRAAPIVLNLNLPAALPDLSLIAESQPDARLSVQVARQTIALSGDQGRFALKLDQLQDRLPEGQYDLTLSARRAGGSKSLRRKLIIDRTAPVFSNLTAERSGRVLRLGGQVQDMALHYSQRLLLQADVDGAVYTRHISAEPGSFDWLLPLPRPDAAVRLSATDAAGNVSYVSP